MKTISALTQQKRNPDRVNVYLDGQFAFGLAKIVAAWLKLGQQLSAEQVNELQAKDEEEVAYQKALHFLSYRPRSQAEVEANLRKHAASPAAIEAAISRLQRHNYINDEDFAQTWVENRSAFRPRGAFALRAELRQKGVAEQLIEQALDGLDESSLAQAAAQKKLRQWGDLEWQEFRRKLSAYLSRRGFGYEVVAEVVRSAWQGTRGGDLPEAL